MDAQKKIFLNDAGINVDEALERFMGNEALLQKYLGRFPADSSYASLVKAFEADDTAAAAAAAHTFKSVCGTLGCSGLQKMVIDQEAAIKGGNWAEAKAMLPEIQNTYNNICAVLKSTQC